MLRVLAFTKSIYHIVYSKYTILVEQNMYMACVDLRLGLEVGFLSILIFFYLNLYQKITGPHWESENIF